MIIARPRTRVYAASALVALLAVGACGGRLPAPSQQIERADAVRARVGKFADDSFYACLLNGYSQGLSIAQIEAECATKLIEDDKKGFGGDIAEIGGRNQSMFDPASVSAACGNSGDPTRGQSSSGAVNVPGYGYYSWGEKTNTEKGLGREESRQQKEELIEKAQAATKAFDEAAAKELAAQKAVKDAKAAGDQEAAKKAEEERKKLYDAAVEKAKAAQQAKDAAKADPNKKPPANTRTVDGETPCEQALQAARELLRECHRTQWKDFRCQQLQAKMNGCPDPALILVDPEQGYTCGAKPDPEKLKDAWVARCEQRTKPGPDGGNPCVRPTLDAPAHFVTGKAQDVCNDPHAYITPDAERCEAHFTIDKPFGQPDIQQIIVLALNKLGGPIIVLPKSGPSPPRPGPDPRPGPR